MSGVGDVSRRRVLQSSAAALALSAAQTNAQVKTLRIGMVGVGGRGTDLLGQILRMDNVAVTAVADIDERRIARAQKLVTDAKMPRPEGYGRGERDYERLCDRNDLDLVINATPWQWHTPISVAAMKAGKHAATEVPAAITLEQCWELVETAEKTGKHCMMMENDCYDPETLMVLNMLRQGLLGEPLFAEGGYMHDLRSVKFGATKAGPVSNAEPWRLEHTLKRNGNLYPTHPIGPISWWLDINRGDRYTSMVSMSSRSGAMREYAEREFGKDDWRAKADYRLGDVNTSILQTARGRLVHLYLDTSTPRVKEHITRLQCAKGVYSSMLGKMFIDGMSFRAEGENWRARDEWEDVAAYKDRYQHKLWRERGQAATGSHGGIDYMLIYRLVKRLQAGLAPDMDVYDAAAWSAIFPLSERSVAGRSIPVDFPDFTRGRWEGRAGINPDEIE
ncbi:MAG: Gfo/Idh/MocA family oxidoreductase [Bryobacterales bacterium]|nr:Gfo/Idh/MocA family oxidoreductase [Bryobacterales bacterium]